MALGVLFKSTTVEWQTPEAIYDALDKEFDFDLDPCPLGGSEDGLSLSWSGKRVFCNPPYGRKVGDWFKRGLEAEIAVFLVPARTDTRWFHEIVIPNATEIRFIKGRLRFGSATENAPFPSMVVIFKGYKSDL